MTAGATVLILGGTSDIGFSIAAAYASKDWRIVLVVRDGAAGERNAADLRTRFRAEVRVVICDVLATDATARLSAEIAELPQTVVSVIGVLGDQARAETDPAFAAGVLRATFEAPALILGAFANRMAQRGSGTIVGVSSVAGDRGRGSNYVYGSAKAGLTAFLSGLRNRMAKRGIHVLTVKPGFVRTKMTVGLALPGPITANPSEVGRAVYRAAQITRRNVIYVRPVWRFIMTVIAAIPETVFKKLGL